MSEEQQFPGENTNAPGNSNPQPFKPFQNSGFNYGIVQSLPNSTVVLILGILSILSCCCYGVIGLVFSIVALILSKSDRALYAANMSYYTEGSYKNLNAGRVCAIIGLILNIICLLIIAIMIAVFGWEILSDKQELGRILESYQS